MSPHMSKTQAPVTLLVHLLLNQPLANVHVFRIFSLYVYLLLLYRPLANVQSRDLLIVYLLLLYGPLANMHILQDLFFVCLLLLYRPLANVQSSGSFMYLSGVFQLQALLKATDSLATGLPHQHDPDSLSIQDFYDKLSKNKKSGGSMCW